MWLDIQIFEFRALWSPYFFLFVLGLALLYYLITGPLRHKFGTEKKPTNKQQIFFYIGLLILYIVKGSPVDLLSHIMLSAHMIQMALFYFVFPIFIIKGLPEWIWEKIVQAPVFSKIFHFLTKPLIAVLLFSSLLAIYHVPAIFDFTKSSQIVHSSTSIIILFTAFIMYWPVIPPLKRYDTMHPLIKMAYLIFSSVIITIACALIIFADTLLFTSYSAEGTWMQAMSLCVPSDVLDGLTSVISGPEMFSPLTAENDQQLGGIIMQMMQIVVFGILIGRIFFSWFSKENMKIDPLPENSLYDS